MVTNIARYWREYRADYQRRPPPSEKMDRAPRVCMRCRKTFDSEWIGNRMCKHCTTISEGMAS